MEHLPAYIKVVFTLTTFLTIILFYVASQKSKTTILVLSAWLVLQALIGRTGFYTITDTIPPRFLLLIGPPVIFILALFIIPRGRTYINALDLKFLTFMHVIRIPVEIVLLWLFLHGVIPERMTFEGINFDILSGITAPLVYYFGLVKKQLNRSTLIAWNLICLGLLFNIVVNAIFSAPTPFQKFAFDQPNIGVLYFPFNWLPACIVPLVLFSHLAALRQLLPGKP